MRRPQAQGEEGRAQVAEADARPTEALGDAQPKPQAELAQEAAGREAGGGKPARASAAQETGGRRQARGQETRDAQGRRLAEEAGEEARGGSRATLEALASARSTGEPPAMARGRAQARFLDDARGARRRLGVDFKSSDSTPPPAQAGGCSRRTEA